ncbi:hypothetical protein DKT68_15245 [Micromonospora acroterricola]|uniref:Phage-related minor tail protein n=1 Tax=Micromonospora acroterricola TaxID=2202421 RepID=A0A317D339_9ACTN|nr:hypothetical protein [Micromonospora acroterricola]PWR08570.1 hypothetical protein DKT68_15245 [Micromonospora acroterricola]
MTRTVKVGLDVDEAPLVRGMDRATGATKKTAAALDDVADSAKDTTVSTDRAKESTEDLGESAKDAGRGLNRLRADAERLDRQIDETTRGIRDLARQIAATSDQAVRADLAKELAGEQGKLRDRVSLRSLIDFKDDDEVVEDGVRIGGRLAENIAAGLSRAGGPISAAMSNVFGTLPPQAQAGIGAGLVGAATLAAPGIAAVLSGAVVGAAGAGGLVGGVAIAAKHPQVQAAAKLTGDTLMRELQRGAVSFVPATVESLGIVRSEIGEIGDDLERAFSRAAPMLAPLTRDVLAGAEDAVDGFATAVQRAGPVVDVLGDIARDAGDLVGDVFEDLSENAYEGSRALAALWGVFSAGIRSVVSTISALTEAYGLMEKFGALLAGDRDKLLQLIVEEHNAKAAGGGLSENLEELIAGFTETGDTVAAAAVEVESLTDAIRRMAGENISAEQANIRLEEAIDRATEAGKKNNDGIDENTEKGRANRQALIGIAEAANASAEAIMTQTGSQDLASAATERGRAKFIEAARAMGVGAGEARRLADQLFAIPAKREVKVSTPGMGSALESARLLKQRIDSIDRRIDIRARMTTTYAGSAHSGQGYSTGMRWGGVVERAQDGLLNLREAGIYSASAPARYAFAEPATGGEAFVPRFGDPDRSLDILSRAARWYGAAVVPGTVSGGAGAAGVPEVRVFIGDRELTDIVDVQISARDRGLKRRVGAGAGASR